MTAARDDAPTIAALALAAVALTTVAHEAIGHGSACLLSVGRIERLTSIYFDCSVRNAWIPAAGPLVNLGWAAAMLAVLAIAPARYAALRLLALASMSFSFFWEAGYLLSAMLIGEGDAFFALRAAFGGVSWPMRVIGCAVGLALYVVSFRLIRHAAKPYNMAPGRLRRLAWIVWISGAIGAALAALLYAPDWLASTRQGLLEVGAASAPLLLLGRSGPDATGAAAPLITRDWRWIAMGALIFIAFALTLGAGLPR